MKIKNRFLRAFFNRCFGEFIFEQVYKYARWKKFAVSISFDVDSREDHKKIPEILDFASSYDKIKFDFAVVGKWVEQYPKIYKRIVDEGHGLLNHTYSHPNHEELNPRYWKQLNRKEQLYEITKCHEVVKKITGFKMKGFRLPHFGSQFDVSLYPLLIEAGYSFSSSCLAVDAEKPYPYKTKEGIIEFPIAICPKHPFTAFDTYHSFRRGGHSENEFDNLFNHLTDLFKKEDLHLNLYFDPCDIKERNLINLKIENTKKLEQLLKRSNYSK
ncbi:MAG: polysaccharide deacetylase family protein [Candidatus Anstonellales archaeon]